ncbi:MAG: hydrogenase nickel incorporation protein HypB, partial [Aridibacter sp.]
PSSYDLGEELRVVLMSVTEGEDKPLKYPTIFNSADIAIITKTDIAEAVEFDSAKAKQSIHSVRPGMKIFELSSKTGEGMNKWMEFLKMH